MEAKKYIDFAPKRRVVSRPKMEPVSVLPEKSADEKKADNTATVAVRINKKGAVARGGKRMAAKKTDEAAPRQAAAFVLMQRRRMAMSQSAESRKVRKKVEPQPADGDESDSLLGVIEDLDRELTTTTHSDDFGQQKAMSLKSIPKMRLSALRVKDKAAAKPKDDRVGFVEGKSPFINVDKLEKRPLSAFRKASDRPMAQRNSYVEQAKIAKMQNDVPTMVVTKASKKSSFSLFIVILLTMALGGVVGFVTYLAFFQ